MQSVARSSSDPSVLCATVPLVLHPRLCEIGPVPQLVPRTLGRSLQILGMFQWQFQWQLMQLGWRWVGDGLEMV